MVNLENGSSLPIRTGFPDSKALLRPASPRVWLADGYDVDSIVSITPGIVAANPDWPDLAGRVREGTIARPTMLVKFKQDRDPAFERTDRGPSCRGDAGDKDVAAPLVWGIFHQVIAANGVQATGWDRPEAGSPYAFAASLKGGSAILHAPLCGCDSTIPVGRHHNSERLRWLASSGHGNWLVIAKSDAPSLALKEYQDRLPAQAIINLQGVTVSAVTVAYANRWFLGYHKHPRRPFNTNINTVPLEELVLAAKWNGKPSTWAANIVKMRTLRTRPFQSLEQVARASVYRSFNEPREVVSDAAIAEACLGRESQVNEELAVLTRAGFTIPYLPGEPSARAY
jgi:hypothetical protein